MIVEWSEGKPLTITVYSVATINASTADYLGSADWEFIPVNGGHAIKSPELSVSLPKGEYQFLVVPREGFTGVTETISNFYGNESKTKLFGGGPTIHQVEIGETVYGNTVSGYALRDSGTFYDREPILKIVYDEDGKTTYLLDWFWDSETPISS